MTSIALITEALLEAAPDGRSVAEVIEPGADGPRACRWSAPRYEHLGPVRLPRTAES